MCAVSIPRRHRVEIAESQDRRHPNIRPNTNVTQPPHTPRMRDFRLRFLFPRC